MNDFLFSLLTWYEQENRTLPWRKKDVTFYEVLVSETMLQQTRIETVKLYYDRFLKKYPTIESLAKAKEEDVYHIWQGLGYYNRAKNLLKTAKILVNCKDFPKTKEDLLLLPGIGDYTSSAIRAIFFHQKEVAFDENLYRLGARLFLTDDKEEIKRKFLLSLKESDPAIFNQALMDIGQLICIPKGNPLCEQCPLKCFCLAYQEKKTQEYPKKKKKKEKALEIRKVFLLIQKDKILLHKRKSTGLLSSLDEFPNILASENFESLKINAHSLRKIGFTHHFFSHKVWEMHYFLGELEEYPKGEDYFLQGITSFDEVTLPSAFSYGVAYLKSLEKNRSN